MIHDVKIKSIGLLILLYKNSTRGVLECLKWRVKVGRHFETTPSWKREKFTAPPQFNLQLFKSKSKNSHSWVIYLYQSCQREGKQPRREGIRWHLGGKVHGLKRWIKVHRLANRQGWKLRRGRGVFVWGKGAYRRSRVAQLSFSVPLATVSSRLTHCVQTQHVTSCPQLSVHLQSWLVVPAGPGSPTLDSTCKSSTVARW